MSRISVRALRVLTPASALASLVANAIALCSNSWLHSTELMPNPSYNGSGDREQLAKNTVSGLWKICFNEPGKSDMNCVMIDYFPKEEYSPDPNDSTMAIPYAVKRASAFILISALVLVVGELLCFLGHLFRRGRVLTFAGGIAFILSGLMILVGMVIYISTFKAEVGSKLRPKSSFQEPLFTYSYGYSFLLAVTGLMSCELAGTFSIFLCIHRYQQQLRKKLDRLKPVDHLPGCRRYQQPLQRHASSASQRLLPHSSSPPPTAPGRSASARRHHSYHQQHTGSEPSSLAFEPPSPPGSSRLHHHQHHQQGGGGRPRLPASESMRDLSYYNFPPFSRDTTCNTVSTTADNLTREYSREFSFETLRRTTPV
ncbi:voltage-dependent calcium channel gamma-7 subunit [Dermacentor silvarum]|uniref:voltage-dependent calcium channel gamma-7 subunit n=1 Tax=Dermacentor silvarum TaxID=543639 RepID=UPI00189A617C|nr:voltage-dependent calcium channel gamma-7 subunit [Dermacentor silvarum]